MYPENTVFDVKRLIGRKYSEKVVQDEQKFWPFKLTSLAGDKPAVKVNYLGQEKVFTPEEISAMVLGKLKAAAEAYLGTPVKDAVITVPAYFNDAQRLATKDAGTIAGLTVHRIINEPTAAALAYGLGTGNGLNSSAAPTGARASNAKEQNILVFDLGGGTFDVSLLTIDEGAFEVLSSSGDTHLGGEDFDNRVVEFLAQEFEKKNAKLKVDLRKNARAMARLRTAAERAKRTLSAQLSTQVEVDALYDGMDFRFTLTRAKFEELNTDLFKKCLAPVESVLRSAKMSKSQIDEVVLVGGSTRIPKVRSLLQEFFNGKDLCMSINPDEAVAYGAAVQAAILSGQRDATLDKVVLIDIAPLSLGIETAGGVMAAIVPHSTNIPCSRKETFSTASDNQPAVDIKVFQGNRTLTAQNHLLGNFTLSGIAPAPRGSPKIEVTFNVDANGILDVSATDSGSNNTKSIRITNDSNRLSDDQIARMQEDAKKFEEEDRKIRDAVEARNSFMDLIYRTKSSLKDPSIASRIPEEDVKSLEAEIESTSTWVEDAVSRDAEEIKARMKQFEAKAHPIISKIYETTNGTTSNGSEKAGPIVDEVD